MTSDLLPLLNLLLLPVVGLLMRISGQLSGLAATTADHHHRLVRLETAHDRKGAHHG